MEEKGTGIEAMMSEMAVSKGSAEAAAKEGKRPRGTGRVSKKIVMVLCWLVIWLSILAGRSVLWVMHEWADLQISEIVWHLMAPLKGTDMGIVTDYARQVVPFATIITVILYVIYRFLFKRKRLVRLLILLAALIYGAGSVIYLSSKLHVVEWLINRHKDSTFIEDNYVDPRDVDIAFPEKKRNLIFIYLESMEVTYADKESGGAFEENVIPELTELALENESFSGDSKKLDGGVALNNTTYTMGAMFGDTSGLPLIIPIYRGRLDIQNSFMPDLVTLGDILEEEGYRQVLQIGSQAVFGGRELYFSSHGNYEIRDYAWSVDNKKIPEDYYVWWGFEDEKLFSMAKETLGELSGGDAPFNLTLLTVDTHYPDGYVCDLCRDDYEVQYSNVWACSSRQVSEFVKWCTEQEWYDNTTIVLVGDHLTMDEDYCEDVSKNYQRKTYTAFINAPVEPKRGTYREYSTLDYFPTTLAALGVEIEGDQLGLGTNLYSDTDTLLEKYDRHEVNLQFERNSEFMNRLTEDMTVKAQAEVEISDYDPETATIHVKVWDLEPESLTGVQVKVYEEGQEQKSLSVALPETGNRVFEGDLDLTEIPTGQTLTIKVNGNEYSGGKRVRAYPRLFKTTIDI